MSGLPCRSNPVRPPDGSARPVDNAGPHDHPNSKASERPNMKRKTLFIIVTCLPMVAFGPTAKPESSAEHRCQALATADFSLLQDAPTQVIGAKVVGRTEQLPGYCEVTGY